MLEELELSEEEELEDVEPTSAINKEADPNDELGSLISELESNSTEETVVDEPAEEPAEPDTDESIIDEALIEQEEDIDEDTILNNILEEIDEIDEIFAEEEQEESNEELEALLNKQATDIEAELEAIEKPAAEEETALDDTPSDDIEEDATEEEPEAEMAEEIEEAIIEEEAEALLPEDEEEDEDPMAALKDMSAETVGAGTDSIDKLKSLSKKIIDGEPVDIGIDLKNEIGELLKLILETKSRVDEIEPTIATSNQQIPNVLNTLESVTETTEDATFTLMENADSLNNYYQEFVEEINDLEDLIYKKDVPSILKKIETIENSMDEADRMGFSILQALEFQDITEQKLRKVIGSISDIGARLGAILGFIKLKQEQDPTVADDASQDDIDKLLAEFGLD